MLLSFVFIHLGVKEVHSSDGGNGGKETQTPGDGDGKVVVGRSKDKPGLSDN